MTKTLFPWMLNNNYLLRLLHSFLPFFWQLCGPGGTTNFSEAIIDFALLRRGCDGVIDSGSLNLDSLCDCDIDVCLDCKGEQGGGKFYMSLCVRKPIIWVPTRSDTNRAVQSQKLEDGNFGFRK